MDSIPIAKPAPWRRPHLRPPVLVAVLLMALAGAAGLVVAFAWPQRAEAPHVWVIVGRVDDLEVGQPVPIQEYGAFLVLQPSGEVLALHRRDPHLGCTIPWRADFTFDGRKGWFRNPCHGQTYDLAGNCVFGPCIRGMDRYPVEIRDGEILIDTKTLVCGPGFTGAPRECVPPEAYEAEPVKPPGLP